MNRRRLALIPLLASLGSGCAPAPRPEAPAAAVQVRAPRDRETASHDDDPRWSSLRALPTAAVPWADPRDRHPSRDRQALEQLAAQRYAEPHARDIASITAWTQQVFVPWVNQHGSATKRLADALRARHDARSAALAGYAYEGMANPLLAVPTPAEVEADAELLAIYRGALEARAKEWLELAQGAYRQSLELAGGASSAWARFASARLALWAPLLAARHSEELSATTAPEPAPIAWPALCEFAGISSKTRAQTASNAPLQIAMVSTGSGPLSREEVAQVLERAGAWVAQHAKVNVIPYGDVLRAEERARRGQLNDALTCLAPVEPERILAASHPNLALGRVYTDCRAQDGQCHVSIAFRRPNATNQESAPPDLPRDTEPVVFASDGLDARAWLSAVGKLRFKPKTRVGEPAWGVIGVLREDPPDVPAFRWQVIPYGGWSDRKEPSARLETTSEAMAACGLPPSEWLAVTLDVARDGSARVVAGLDPVSSSHACAARVLSGMHFGPSASARRLHVDGQPGPVTPFRAAAYRVAAYTEQGATDDAERALSNWPIAQAITRCKQGPQATSAAAWNVSLDLAPNGGVASVALTHLTGPATADEERCVREALAKLEFACPLAPAARIEARICATSSGAR